jgi:hypothetical protein
MKKNIGKFRFLETNNSGRGKGGLQNRDSKIEAGFTPLVICN